MHSNPFNRPPASALLPARVPRPSTGAAACWLAGCGGGRPAPAARASAASAARPTPVPRSTWPTGTASPAATAPSCKALVKQFNGEHDKIADQDQHDPVGGLLPAAARRGHQAGKGPDVGVMHLDQLATNAARSVIVPLDDLAKALGAVRERLRPDGVEGRASTRTSATASRSTCTRSRMYYNKDHFEKAGIDPTSRRRTRRASTRRCKKLRKAGVQGVLDARTSGRRT